MFFTERFKTIILIALAVLCVIVGCISAFLSRSNYNDRYNEWLKNAEIITVIIQRGDTIDGYYAQYAPEWMDRYTYRQLILDLNHMNNCDIYAGDIIKLYR